MIGEAGLLSWTPSIGQEGIYEITVVVSDTHEAVASQSFSLNIEPRANTAPVFSSNPSTNVLIGQNYLYQISVEDAESDATTLTLVTSPEGMVLDAASNTLSWSPLAADEGAHEIVIEAKDIFGSSISQAYTLSVSFPNRMPVISSEPATVATETQLYSYQLVASDPDQDSLSFELISAPTGMAINALTGEINWIPAFEHVGTAQVSVKAVDPSGAFATQSFTITVSARDNQAPQITSTPNLIANINELYQYQLEVSDPESDPLMFEITQAPSGMDLSASGLLTWLPASNNIGEHAITIVISDNRGASISQSFMLTVESSGAAPVITSSPVLNATENQAYSYQVVASDQDQDIETYELISAPVGMSINPATGLIEWVPDQTYAQSMTQQNNSCVHYESQEQSFNSGSVDIVVLTDNSGSMTYKEKKWSNAFTLLLDAHLRMSEIGGGEEKNQYGFLPFAASASTILGYENKFYNLKGFTQVFEEYIENGAAGGGGDEDGIAAMGYVLDNYSFNENSSKHFFLVTDEGRTYNNPNYNFAQVLTELKNREVKIHAVISQPLQCNDGTSAIGLSADGQGVTVDEEGNIGFCDASLPPGTVIDHYLQAVLETGGSVWRLENINSIDQEIFAEAILRFLMPRIEQDLQTKTEQADLAIKHVEYQSESDQGIIRVEIINRGLAAFNEEFYIDVNFGQNSLTQTVSSLGELESTSLVFSVPSSENVPDIHTAIRISEASEECLGQNNSQSTPVISVKVVDAQNNAAIQKFSIAVAPENAAPTLNTIVDQTIYVGHVFEYQAVATDVNIGDAINYSIQSGPANLTILPELGLLNVFALPSHEGSHLVTIRATDLSGAFAETSFYLNVVTPNDNLAITNVIDFPLVHSEAYTYLPVLTGSSETDEFILLEAPDGLVMDPTTGLITWTPSADLLGIRVPVSFGVRNASGAYDIQAVMISIDAPPSPPRIITTPPNGQYVGNRTGFGYPVELVDDNLFDDYTWAIEGVNNLAFDLNRFEGDNKPRPKYKLITGTVNTEISQRKTLTNAMCFAAENEEYSDKSFSVIEDWSWNAAQGVSNLVTSYLKDTNRDGVTNKQDDPYIVGLASSMSGFTGPVIFALNANSKQVLWAYADIAPNFSVTPAIGDIDNDGTLEVVFVSSDKKVTALDSDANLLWQSTAQNQYKGGNSSIVLSDLNNDGSQEVLWMDSAWTANGQWLWKIDFSDSPYYYGNNSFSPLVVDINNDGSKEVFFGGRLVDANGQLVWKLDLGTSFIYDFATALGNFDGDPEPEIVAIMNNNFFSVIELDGSFLVPLKAINNNIQQRSFPVVADFDNDGLSEVYLSAFHRFYDSDGTSLHASIYGQSRGSIASDLNGDGVIELITRSAGEFYILPSVTANREFAIPSISNSSYDDIPVLVDADKDGSPEIVLGSNSGLKSYKQINSAWKAPFITQNQRRVGPAMSSNPNVWLGSQSELQITPRKAVDPSLISDLWIGQGWLVDNNGQYDISFEIKNLSRGPVNTSFYVRAYNGNPETSSPELLGETLETMGNAYHETTTAVISNIDTSKLTDHFYGRIEYSVDPESVDCWLGNNLVSMPVNKVSATDSAGFVAEQYFTARVIESRQTPSNDPIVGATTIQEGEVLDILATSKDRNNDSAVTYELNAAPKGVKLNHHTGQITWETQSGDSGSYSIQIYVATKQGRWIRTINVTVTPASFTSQAPAITSSPETIAEIGSYYQYQLVSSDPDGDAVSYRLTEKPHGMKVDSETGLISWVPDVTQGGNQNVKLLAIDSTGAWVEQVFVITVYADSPLIENQPPIISSRPVWEVLAGQSYQYSVLASDLENDSLTFELVEHPAGMTIDARSGLIQWMPGVTDLGVHIVSLKVTDSAGSYSTQQYNLQVTQQNTAPLITSSPITETQSEVAYQYQVIATDAENDALSYSLASAPNGMTINPLGLVSWTPNANQEGVHAVVLQVTDTSLNIATQTYDLLVTNGQNNQANLRLINQPQVVAFVGQPYLYRATGISDQGSDVTISLVNGPAGMTITPNKPFPGYFELAWTPDAGNCQHDVTLELADNFGNTQQITYTIDVYSAPKKQNRFQCSVDAEFCATR